MNRIAANEVEYLYTKLSQINDSGIGLFTAIKIYKDEIIAYFTGKLLSASEINSKQNSGLDQYFINMPDGQILDSLNSKCFAKFANDAKGVSKSKYRNNSKIVLDNANRVCLIAKRKIMANEEIFCSYGKDYWNNRLKSI